MNPNHNISAVIIAYNEQKYISQCIKSILPITHDIIVVDSGSTDDTVELANAAGAKVFHMDWKGYGANKNFGISKAQYDWILSIDADEIIDEQLLNAIITCEKDPNFIYQIKSLVNYAGKWIRYCGWFPSWKLRFFNKKTATWNLDPVHEQLIYGPSIQLKKLDGQLLHYSYDSIEDHIKKSKNYARLKAEVWIKNDKHIGILTRLLGPTFKFIRTYILKLGILDGKAGFTIAKIDATAFRLAIDNYLELKSN